MRRSLPERVRRRLRRSVLAPFDAHVLGALRRRLHAGREFRPVFVAGAMGSGTTLLTLSLAQRFEFGCVVTESAHQVRRDSFLYNPGVDAFPSVRAYEDAIRPRSDWSEERGRADLAALYRSHASGSSAFALDKGPNTNLVRAAFLSRCFPEACFVAVFRDPVANVEGFRRKWRTFGGDSLEECVRFYAAIHEDFLSQAEAFSERVIWVEYERLVADHEAVLEALGRRIGLAPAGRRRRLPRRENVPGQGIRNVAGSQIGVVQGANEAALQNLPESEIEGIREMLGPLHERLRTRAVRLSRPTPSASAPGSDP